MTETHYNFIVIVMVILIVGTLKMNTTKYLRSLRSFILSPPLFGYILIYILVYKLLFHKLQSHLVGFF